MNTKTKKGRLVKIGHCADGCYEIAPTRAVWREELGFRWGISLASFCERKFERTTGFKLKVDETAIVRIRVTRVRQNKTEAK